MTRVVYYAAMSLDGYIAEADDTIDWLTSYAGQPPADEVEPIERGYEDFYRRVGALVCGSVTYEWILDHISRGGDWPYAGKPCWILSSRELRVLEGDVDVRVVDGSVSELFERMAESAGDADLWVVGGGNVASQFADTGLLDEVRVTVVPVVLGAGARSRRSTRVMSMSLSACPPRIASGSRSGRSSRASSIEDTMASGAL